MGELTARETASRLDNSADASLLSYASRPDSSHGKMMSEAFSSGLLAHTASKTRDTLSGAVGDGLQAAAHAAIQAPTTGVLQIVDYKFDTKLAESKPLIEAPAPAEFGSTRWHAQQLGSAAGMIAPFLLVAKCSRGVIGKFEASSGVGLAAEGASLSRGAAGMAVLEQGLNGFIFDAALRPSDPNSTHFVQDRLQHGLVGAATFSTLTASSIGLRSLGRTPASSTGLGAFFQRDVLPGVISGVPAGLVSAHGNSLVEHGKLASTGESLKSAYTMAFIGGGLSALHVIPGERVTLSERIARGEGVDAGRARLRAALESKSQGIVEGAGQGPLGRGTLGRESLGPDLLGRRGSSELSMAGSDTPRLNSNLGSGIDLVRMRAELLGERGETLPPTERSVESGTPRVEPQVSKNADLAPPPVEAPVIRYKLGDTNPQVEYANKLSDGTIDMKLVEAAGDNPPGTVMRIFPEERYPGGIETEFGNAHALAWHPDGTFVVSRTDGNSHWKFAESRTIEYEGGSFVSDNVHRLSEGSEVWTTTDGKTIEVFADGHLPRTNRGDVFRIDSDGNTRTYHTADGGKFDVVQLGDQVSVIDYQNGQVVKNTYQKEFVETFPSPKNFGRWGNVENRTIFGDGSQMTLSNGDRPFSYSSRRTLPDGRGVVDGIKHPDSVVRYILEDGTHYVVNSKTDLKAHDWATSELNPTTRNRTITNMNGDSFEYRPDGSVAELYKNGVRTSAGEYQMVVRTNGKSEYFALDGSKMVVTEGHPGQIRLFDTKGADLGLARYPLREIYEAGRITEFGTVREIQRSKDSSSRHYMIHDGRPESIESMVFHPGDRSGIEAFAMLNNGMGLIHHKGGFIPHQLRLHQILDLRHFEDVYDNGYKLSFDKDKGLLFNRHTLEERVRQRRQSEQPRDFSEQGFDPSFETGPFGGSTNGFTIPIFVEPPQNVYGIVGRDAVFGTRARHDVYGFKHQRSPLGAYVRRLDGNHRQD